MSDPNDAQTPYDPNLPGGQPMDYNAVEPEAGRPVSTIVLGIIGILYAAYLTICVCAGVAMSPFAESFAEMADAGGNMTAEQRAQMVAQMSMGPWKLAISLLMVLTGMVCWVGAIGSLMGRETGRKALLLFAVLYLAVTVIYTLIEAMRGFPDIRAQAQMQAGGAGMATGAMIAVAIGITVLLLAYPVCVLFFYTRQRVIRWFEANTAAASNVV